MVCGSGPSDGEEFTADPGHVGGFGVLVDGVGRGLPRAVACGKEFTLVATYPYEGPVMEVREQKPHGILYLTLITKIMPPK